VASVTADQRRGGRASGDGGTTDPAKSFEGQHTCEEGRASATVGGRLETR
jgi:hypothetical protein